MIATKLLNNGHTRIYSTDGKLIKDEQGYVHSEYIVKEYNIDDYVEIENEQAE